jgi:hypothetical protein
LSRRLESNYTSVSPKHTLRNTLAQSELAPDIRTMAHVPSLTKGGWRLPRTKQNTRRTRDNLNCKKNKTNARKLMKCIENKISKTSCTFWKHTDQCVSSGTRRWFSTPTSHNPWPHFRLPILPHSPHPAAPSTTVRHHMRQEMFILSAACNTDRPETVVIHACMIVRACVMFVFALVAVRVFVIGDQSGNV